MVWLRSPNRTRGSTTAIRPDCGIGSHRDARGGARRTTTCSSLSLLLSKTSTWPCESSYVANGAVNGHRIRPISVIAARFDTRCRMIQALVFTGRGTLTYALSRSKIKTQTKALCANTQCVHGLSSVSVVVIAVLVPPATPVTITVAIPLVVMIVVAAWRRPVPLEVPATIPVGLDPVRVGERWARPISVVPEPTSIGRIPIAFHPDELWPWLRRHPIDSRRWRRRSKPKTERNLCVHGRCGEQKREKG